jgi:hypothetical protein
MCAPVFDHMCLCEYTKKTFCRQTVHLFRCLYDIWIALYKTSTIILRLGSVLDQRWTFAYALRCSGCTHPVNYLLVNRSLNMTDRLRETWLASGKQIPSDKDNIILSRTSVWFMYYHLKRLLSIVFPMLYWNCVLANQVTYLSSSKCKYTIYLIVFTI